MKARLMSLVVAGTVGASAGCGGQSTEPVSDPEYQEVVYGKVVGSEGQALAGATVRITGEFPCQPSGSVVRVNITPRTSDPGRFGFLFSAPLVGPVPICFEVGVRPRAGAEELLLQLGPFNLRHPMNDSTNVDLQVRDGALIVLDGG